MRQNRGLRGLLAAYVFMIASACIPAPDGPRYRGAGHTSPVYGGTFNLYHESDVRSLDPHVALDEVSNVAIKLLFDGLYDYDSNARIIPSLAAELPQISDDGLQYTVRLKHGVKFHNGRQLVADDIKWSFERMLHPDLGSAGFSFVGGIKGVNEYREGRSPHIAGIEVLDEHTVMFSLSQRDQTFVYGLATTFSYPLPKEHVEAHHGSIDRMPVGTGPFRLIRWEPGVALEFEKNRHYWDPKRPYVDRMVFTVNLGREAAVMRFRNGEIDAIHRFTPADYIFFKKSKNWAPFTTTYPSVDLWGLVMNCELEPFNNRHVRRAVAMGIDRERWHAARGRRFFITDQAVPPGLLGHIDRPVVSQRFNLAKAKKEMVLAGYADGYSKPVELWMTDGDTSQQYGELIQADLARIGIKVALKFVSFPVYLEETGKRKTAQMLWSGWSQDYPDPADFLDILFHSRSIHPTASENRSFYRNPELDTVLDEARGELNTVKRAWLYRQASEMIAEDAPWAFVLNNEGFEVWQPYVKAYVPNPVWQEMYRDVWLDLPRTKIR